MKTSYIFLAPGFEETEAMATVDVLRRCGINILTVSILEDVQVTGAHNIIVIADKIIKNADCAAKAVILSIRHLSKNVFTFPKIFQSIVLKTSLLFLRIKGYHELSVLASFSINTLNFHIMIEKS